MATITAAARIISVASGAFAAACSDPSPPTSATRYPHSAASRKQSPQLSLGGCDRGDPGGAQFLEHRDEVPTRLLEISDAARMAR